MARPLRIEYPGAYYHAMNRGMRRRRTFCDEEDHERFVRLLETLWMRWQVKVFAYCCMSSHYHLFLQTPRGNLSRVMRHVDGVYTQQYNRRYKRDGPLFRGRYKGLLVDADSYFLQLVRYIHLNPVEAKLVEEPGQYRWGSHRLYRLRACKRPRWLAWQEVLRRFPSQRAFDRFVAEGNDQSLTAFYRKCRWSPFLGEESFTKEALKKARLSDKHPRAEKTPQFPDIAAVIAQVSELFSVDTESVLTSRRGQENIPRNLAIFIASRLAGFSHREIEKVFHLRSDSAVSRVCQRTQTNLDSTPELRRRMEKLGNLKD